MIVIIIMITAAIIMSTTTTIITLTTNTILMVAVAIFRGAGTARHSQPSECASRQLRLDYRLHLWWDV